MKKGRIYDIILTDKILSKNEEKGEVWGTIKERRNPRFSFKFLWKTSRMIPKSGQYRWKGDVSAWQEPI